MKIFAVLLLLLSVVCYADTPEEKPDYEFQLIEPISVRNPLTGKGDKQITSIKQSEIDEIKNKPLINDALQTFRYTLAESSGRHVKGIVYVQTLNQFLDAREVGCSVMLNSALSTMQSFWQLNKLLNSLKDAQPAEKSFITDVTISNLELLPIEYFHYELNYSWKHGPPPLPEEDLGKTLQDKVDEKELTILEKTKRTIHVRSSRLSLSWRETVRADFNGDGIEDIWLKGWWGFRTARQIWYTVAILTRTSPDGKFEMIDWDTVYADNYLQ